MPNQGDTNRIEPAIPQGTNAGLLSSTGTPIHTDTGLSADGSSDSSGLMGRVSNVVDSGKSKLAGGLHDLGDRIEHQGRTLQSGSMLVRPVGRVLNSTGEALEGGARYLQSNDVDVIRDDVVDGIRARPLMAAGIALGCGWLLGKMLGSDDESDHSEHEAHDREWHREHSRSRHEDEEESDDSHSSFRDGLVHRVSGVLASGVASMAARRVRDRIAGH